jgi:toxin ParE1/3/4
MTRRLIVRPRARLELAEASDWYDHQRPDLGADFIRAYEAVAAAILDNPFQYQIIGRGFRRAGLHRFPYGLVYTVSDEEVVVLACFHGHRNPSRWRDEI